LSRGARSFGANQEAKSAALEELEGDKVNVKNGGKRLHVGLVFNHFERLFYCYRMRRLEYRNRGKASSSRQKAEEAKASQAASTSQNKALDSLTRLGSRHTVRPIDKFVGRYVGR